MNEFDSLEKNRAQYSCWISASCMQRPEHLIAAMHPRTPKHPWGGPCTYRMIHITIQKWDSIPVDFLEVALKIKDFERKYQGMAVRYSIILHGRKESGIENTKYQHGCFIYYSPFDSRFRINKVNRTSKALIAMLKTARYWKGEIETVEQEQITKEGKVLSKKQLEIRKRVLKNYKGFISV